MAKAKLSTITMKPVRRVTLELEEKEYQTLMAILALVSGHAPSTRRRHADAILSAIMDATGETYDTSDVGMKREIRFDGEEK